MQISKSTIDILKNFSGINGSILVKPGNRLDTISITKNILASAEISETFDTEFGIYDVAEFLNVVTSEEFIGGDFTWEEKYVTMSKDRAVCRYIYADSSTVVSPENAVKMPDAEINFKLTQEDFNAVKNMSSALGKNDLALISDGVTTNLSVLDRKDPTTNNFEIVVGDRHPEKFSMYFKVENLKIMNGDYDVQISSTGISYLKHTEIPVEYWNALEPDSVYGENA